METTAKTTTINLPQQYFSKIMRAVVEFDMIADGDKILVGVSGGKDSIFLLYALALLKKRIKKKFSLAALTIDPMFTDDFDVAPIADFCRSLDVPFDSFAVDIAGTIKASGKNPCFTCAFFRRGAINRYAKERGMNKIAYAHHNDDAVETFFMSLLYSGQLTTFTPVTHLSRTGLTVIRPLVYFREREIKKCAKYHGFTPLNSPCPRDGNTARQKVKDLIKNLSAENERLYPHLFAAMHENALGELWPAAKTKADMRKIYFDYIG